MKYLKTYYQLLESNVSQRYLYHLVDVDKIGYVLKNIMVDFFNESFKSLNCDKMYQKRETKY
jgi:hypothetical protein